MSTAVLPEAAELQGRQALEPLLRVEDLVVDYYTPKSRVRAVDHVTFDVLPGEIVGLAGESGCGKSTCASAILRLLKPPATISNGRILFKGRDLVTMRKRELRQLRWRHFSIVFQSAMNVLNPVLSVGSQFVDMIHSHEDIGNRQAWSRAGDMLEIVGIPRGRAKSFAHELSGGMRQRVVIGMALALNPELLILDEPTTALDVVVQRQILHEVRDLQQQLKFAVLFITHDLSLLVQFSNRIAIMYAGEIVEMAPAQTLFRSPKHPYTQGLMNSFPPMIGERRRLQGIPGSPPDLSTPRRPSPGQDRSGPPQGCRFAPRCTHAMGKCIQHHPTLVECEPAHPVRCFLYGDAHDR
jgi:peptide/nickel transport system ATP-binding protein